MGGGGGHGDDGGGYNDDSGEPQAKQMRGPGFNSMFRGRGYGSGGGFGGNYLSGWDMGGGFCFVFLFFGGK